MKLILRKVRFCNFMSFGNMTTEIELNGHQTTLVVGKNGSGKSSAILDSISFALFNKPFRNIRKPQLANSINNKNCIVELDFSINNQNFTVRRGIKPNLFEIYKDGELITQAADNRDYQAAFEKYILKINHKTFCQIVMLGSAIFTPFMGLPSQARRDVIEDLLDLKIFSIMNTLLKDKITKCEQELDYTKTEEKIYENQIATTQKYITASIQSNDDLIHEKEEYINKIEYDRQTHSIEIVKLQEKIESLVNSLGDLEKVNKKWEEMLKLEHQMEIKRNSLGKELKFFTENEDCPTCQQPIDEVFKTKVMEDKLNQHSALHNGIIELKDKIKVITDRLNEISDIQMEIQKYNNQIKDHRAEMSAMDKNIAHLETDIAKLKEAKEAVDLTELENMTTRLEKIKTSLVELSDDRTVMGFAANLLKDTGIKAKIIKTYVPVINNLIAKYLAALDFFVSFELDENFNETIKSRFRDEFSYSSFSQGEKMRLDIAILFAWRAISKMRGSIDCNLIVMDEILDSSLDVTGIDDMMKLLSNLTNNENVFIISHREDQIGDKFSRTLRFQKSRNFSEMIGG